MTDLSRYERAQDRPGAGYATALSEMQAGRKTSHWIWYIFPQLAGLGRSSVALAFALDDVDEAVAYLRNETLRSRLLEISTVVAARLAGPSPSSLRTLMGSPIDALKLVSSMTLFAEVARRLAATDGQLAAARLALVAEEILEAAATEGFGRCRHTLAELEP